MLLYNLPFVIRLHKQTKYLISKYYQVLKVNDTSFLTNEKTTEDQLKKFLQKLINNYSFESHLIENVKLECNEFIHELDPIEQSIFKMKVYEDLNISRIAEKMKIDFISVVRMLKVIKDKYYKKNDSNICILKDSHDII